MKQDENDRAQVYAEACYVLAILTIVFGVVFLAFFFGTSNVPPIVPLVGLPMAGGSLAFAALWARSV